MSGQIHCRKFGLFWSNFLTVRGLFSIWVTCGFSYKYPIFSRKNILCFLAQISYNFSHNYHIFSPTNIPYFLPHISYIFSHKYPIFSPTNIPLHNAPILFSATLSVDADSLTAPEKPRGLKARTLMLKVFPGARVGTEKWGVDDVRFRNTPPASSRT